MDCNRDWISATEAARKADVGRNCITDWCGRYGLGKKVAGRWRVDPVALDRLLTGNLEAHDGDHAPRAA